MAAMDEDDRPKKKIVHEIGQELALISVKELHERIALLREEIARLEADIAQEAGVAQSRRPVLQEVIEQRCHTFGVAGRDAPGAAGAPSLPKLIVEPQLCAVH